MKKISPLFKVIYLSKNAELSDMYSEAQKEEIIKDADTVEVDKYMMWSNLVSVEAANREVQDIYLNSDVYYIETRESGNFHAVIKDFEEFKKDWLKAIEDHDLL